MSSHSVYGVELSEFDYRSNVIRSEVITEIGPFEAFLGRNRPYSVEISGQHLPANLRIVRPTDRKVQIERTINWQSTSSVVFISRNRVPVRRAYRRLTVIRSKLEVSIFVKSRSSWTVVVRWSSRRYSPIVRRSITLKRVDR